MFRAKRQDWAQSKPEHSRTPQSPGGAPGESALPNEYTTPDTGGCVARARSERLDVQVVSVRVGFHAEGIFFLCLIITPLSRRHTEVHLFFLP
jgi:hypothetical protein